MDLFSEPDLKFIADKVSDQVVAKLSESYRDMVFKEVRQRAINFIDKELGNLANQRFYETNRYGERVTPNGEGKSLTELILGQVNDYLNERVDSCGIKATDRHDRQTRLTFLIQQEVNKHITDLVRGQATQLREAIVAGMAKVVASAMGNGPK